MRNIALYSVYIFCSGHIWKKELFCMLATYFDSFFVIRDGFTSLLIETPKAIPKISKKFLPIFVAES